jgi:hypothetical protein
MFAFVSICIYLMEFGKTERKKYHEQIKEEKERQK